MDYDTLRKVFDELRKDRDQAWKMFKDGIPGNGDNTGDYLFGRYSGLNMAIMKVTDLMANYSKGV